ncbi:hypothetical protein ACSFA3_04410 [Variovorax sp. RHLX14]|uniref:hypothetical protein n=1 Tax=Variovorax sp. RHLX14 TaxID=1259731 RepID=UPI003F46C56B
MYDLFFKNFLIGEIFGSNDDRKIIHASLYFSNQNSPAIMNNEKITGDLPITRQSSTRLPSNPEIAPAPQFVRPNPPVQTQNIATSITSSTTTPKTPAKNRISATPGSFYSSGNLNISDYFRRALLNNGPDYTYKAMKDDPMGKLVPTRRQIQGARAEFGFGTTKEQLQKLFTTMKEDIAVNDNNITKYDTELFTNPKAVYAMRHQAVTWSRAPGNDISAIQTNDMAIRTFFRKLALNIPEQYREAALAMIDQPPEYRRPLPGTRSAKIATEQPAQPAQPQQPLQPLQSLQGGISLTASNPALLSTQAPPAIYPSNANALLDPAAVSEPLTVEKRVYWHVNSEPTSYGRQSPTFKRTKFEDVSQALPTSAYHPLQPSSSGPTFNRMGQPDVQQQLQPQLQLQTQPTYESGSQVYQPNLFQGGSSIDPSQSQSQSTPSSSWTASNGMNRPTTQQRHQPQTRPQYSSGAMNYQANAFQNVHSIDQPQFQPTPYTQGFSNSGPQIAQAPQLNQGSASQGINTSGSSIFSQSYDDLSPSFASVSPAGSYDSEFDEFIRIIENSPSALLTTNVQSAPILPDPLNSAATPVAVAVAVAVANSQSTPAPVATLVAQQPGTTG